MKVLRQFASAAIVVAFSAGLAAQEGGHIGPSGGEVAGAAIGIGAAVTVVVALAVNHSHHAMSGCVVSGPHGLELQTSDSRTYALEGDAAGLKVDERVRIHGSKVKKATGVPGPDIFKVEKLDKVYGACHLEHPAAQGAAL